jgi:hypothetical protein
MVEIAIRGADVMWYLLAADFTLVVHLLFIGFAVGGSFLAWRWRPLIWVQQPRRACQASCPVTCRKLPKFRVRGRSRPAFSP